MAAGGGGRLGGAAETFPVTTTDLEGVLAGGGVLAVEGALGGEGALVAEEGSKDQVTLVKQVRKTRKFVFRKSIRHTYYMMCNKNLLESSVLFVFYAANTRKLIGQSVHYMQKLRSYMRFALCSIWFHKRSALYGK